MGNDSLLGNVAWAWLVEALEADRAPSYRNAGGTATRILSESFGALATRPDAMDIELRASWTPTGASIQRRTCRHGATSSAPLPACPPCPTA